MKKPTVHNSCVLFAAVSVSAQKRAVFITAGQSNADGREYISTRFVSVSR